MVAKSWERTKVTEGILAPFIATGSVSVGNYRIPKAMETMPAPETGEYVTFISHLEHGFGTPSSLFF
jgi:hypothetical protein